MHAGVHPKSSLFPHPSRGNNTLTVSWKLMPSQKGPQTGSSSGDGIQVPQSVQRRNRRRLGTDAAVSPTPETHTKTPATKPGATWREAPRQELTAGEWLDPSPSYSKFNIEVRHPLAPVSGTAALFDQMENTHLAWIVAAAGLPVRLWECRALGTLSQV